MNQRRTSRLVGRDLVLARLDDDLQAAARGHLGVTLITAPAGVGKTRLLTEFVAARARGSTALQGRAYPLGTTDALGVWIDALESHLRTLLAEEVRALCGPALNDLAAVLPSARFAADTPGGVDAPPSRVRVLDAMARLLQTLSKDKPLMVVLDDVHLADGSSWAALSYLTHHLARSRILVLLASRSVELRQDQAASDVVMALQQEGLLRREPLDVLSPADVAALATETLGQPSPDGLTRFLLDRSRGVPLFALSLLRALAEEGADLAAPVLKSLPEDLAGYVHRQVGQLPTSARHTVELLAVLGKRADLDLLRAMSPSDEEELADTLDLLVRNHLVNEEEHGRLLQYELAHPLIQEAVYHGIGGARRQSLHRAIARMLVASDRLGAAAGHFARSARPGDGEAVEVLRLALARAEERDDHREALSLLDALLDMVPAGDRRWLDIAEVMAWQNGWVIDHRGDIGFETALRAMRRIDLLLDTSASISRRAAAKFHLGNFLVWGAGDVETGQPLIEEAVTLFEATKETRSSLLARNELGYVRAIGGDHRGLGEVARTVLVDASDDPVVALQALSSLAHALVWAAELDGARPVIEEALRLARETGNLYRVSYLLAQLGYECALSGDQPRARELFQLARDANGAHLDTHLPDYASFSSWLAGRLADGIGWGREALAWDGGRISRRRAFGACFAALCALESGSDDEPAGLAATMRAAFEGGEWWFHSALPDWLDASIEFFAGNHAAALRLLDRALRRSRHCGTDLWTAFLLAEYVETAHTAGEQIALLDPAAHEPLLRSEAPGLRAVGALVLGVDASLVADIPQAEHQLRAAATGFAAAGWTLWEGRAWHLLGKALGRHNRAASAQALDAAIRRFAECGAHRRISATQRTIDEFGSGRPTRSTGSSLTKREREVALHALRGESAREIAAHLYIGERTVETHLAHVYAKLGLSGRVDLIRRYRDGDLP